MAITKIVSDNGVISGTAGLKFVSGNSGTLEIQSVNSSGVASTAIAVTDNQYIGIGTTSPSGLVNIVSKNSYVDSYSVAFDQKVTLIAPASEYPAFIVHAWGGASTGGSVTETQSGEILLVRNRGPVDEPLSTIDGDTIGAIIFRGYNSLFGEYSGCSIMAYQTGSPTVNGTPMALDFKTNDGSNGTSGTSRVYIDDTGNVGIGTTIVDESIWSTGCQMLRMTSNDNYACINLDYDGQYNLYLSSGSPGNNNAYIWTESGTNLRLSANNFTFEINGDSNKMGFSIDSNWVARLYKYIETGSTSIVTQVNDGDGSYSVTIPLDGRIYSVTLSQNVDLYTTDAPTAPLCGSAIIYITQASTAKTVTVPAGWYWRNNIVETFSTNSGYYRLTLVTDPAGNIHADAELRQT